MDSHEHSCFVAGATGFTGRALVSELCKLGVKVRAHVRPDSSALDSWRARLGAMGAEVSSAAWEPAALAAELAELQPTHVFSLVGTTARRARRARRSGGAPESYESVDLGLTQMLLEAAAALCPAPTFVYLSSVGVGPRARGAYMRARWSAEEAVRASGLPSVILRPSIISGPGRDEARLVEHTGAVLLAGAFAVLRCLGARELRARYGPIDAPELARALVRAAFDPKARGKSLAGSALRGRPGP